MDKSPRWKILHPTCTSALKAAAQVDDTSILRAFRASRLRRANDCVIFPNAHLGRFRPRFGPPDKRSGVRVCWRASGRRSEAIISGAPYPSHGWSISSFIDPSLLDQRCQVRSRSTMAATSSICRRSWKPGMAVPVRPCRIRSFSCTFVCSRTKSLDERGGPMPPSPFSP